MKLETLAKRHKAIIPTQGSKMYLLLDALVRGKSLSMMDAKQYKCTSITQRISNLRLKYGWSKVIKKRHVVTKGGYYTEYYV